LRKEYRGKKPLLRYDGMIIEEMKRYSSSPVDGQTPEPAEFRFSPPYALCL
jgi:hypothetical protein